MKKPLLVDLYCASVNKAIGEATGAAKDDQQIMVVFLIPPQTDIYVAPYTLMDSFPGNCHLLLAKCWPGGRVHDYRYLGGCCVER